MNTEICDICGGSGIITSERVVIQRDKEIFCPTCKGTGLMNNSQPSVNELCNTNTFPAPHSSDSKCYKVSSSYGCLTLLSTLLWLIYQLP